MHVWPEHAGITDHSVDLSIPVPYDSMLHIPLTNLLLLAAKQKPYKKAYLSTKNIGRIFCEKFRRMDQQAEKKR